jgi:hypothetical protein
MDPLSAVFLGCFVFGFAALVISLLLGGLEGFDVGGHHFDLFGGGHADAGHLHAADAGGHLAAGDGGAVAHADAAHGGHAAEHGGGGGFPWLSFLSPSSVLTFLTWFGGAGFILRNYYGAVAVLSLGLAALAGIVGASLVVAFMLKVLLPHQTVMRQADYDPVGSLGRVTVPIRAGGVGEVVYTRGGTRRSAGARSLDGDALERGVEVVIAKYEHGLAYVQPWEAFVSGESRTGAAEGNT